VPEVKAALKGYYEAMVVSLNNLQRGRELAK